MNTAEFIWSCAQCHAAPELIDPRVAAAWPELLFWDKFHFLHDLGWRHAWLHGGPQYEEAPSLICGRCWPDFAASPEQIAATGGTIFNFKPQ